MPEEEKQLTELKGSLGRFLALTESRNPFRIAWWISTYFLSKCFQRFQKGFFEFYMEGRASREQRWREKHADPVFGMPDEDYDWLEFAVWKFSKAPFRHARVSTVVVKTHGAPTSEYRELFLWLEKKMPAIQGLVPDLLMAEAEIEADCGEADPQRAAAAFAPASIFLIDLENERPVLWKIHAHHPTEQDVYVTIEGKDEVLTRAYLSM